VLEAPGVAAGRNYARDRALKDYFRIAGRGTQRDILDTVTEKILGLDPALEPTRPALLALWTCRSRFPVAALDPSQRRQRTLDGLRASSCARPEQPVLVVFEDSTGSTARQALLIASSSACRRRRSLLVDYRPRPAPGAARCTTRSFDNPLHGERRYCSTRWA
jgi:hypothetical protein